LIDKGDYDGAEPLYREAIAIGEKILGREHPRVALLLNNHYSGAEPLYRESLATRKKALGNEHPVATCG